MAPYEITEAHHAPEIQEFHKHASTESTSLMDSSHLAKNILRSNYTTHGPINITSDEEFAMQKAVEDWEGDGTVENPYIIQEYNITFNGINIHIINVSVYFEIRDCLLISTSSKPLVGIYDGGISIVNSTNGAILNNVILGSANTGIFVGWSNCKVMGNQFDQFNGISNNEGISFFSSSGSVTDNELLNCEQTGIWAYDSSGLELNSNSITGGEIGIHLRSLRDCTVVANEVQYVNGTGIWLEILENCSITSNEIQYCTEEGIQAVWSSDVDFRLNSVADCGRSIYLGHSNEIEVSDNTFVRGGGVMLDYIAYCSVTNNEILFALEAGIWSILSRELMINQNVIQFAENYGIYAVSSSFCSIIANEVSRSPTGILIDNSHNSIFSYNHLVYNLNHGIRILDGISNSLYGNLFGGLSSVRDDGRDNVWDDGDRIGNYWSDVLSLSPVSIEGVAESEDRYPLLIIPTDSQMPTITCPPIISPYSYNSAILTWVIWSSPGTYAVYHNEQQLESGVRDESGSLSVLTNILSDGNHTFRLVVTDDESVTVTSILRLCVPGFECFNDADADGMPDMWEIENGFHPSYATDANEDADSDGLINLEEYNRGTDPYSNDSDIDSIPDLWEVRNGFDPLNPEIPLIEYIGYFHPYVYFAPLSVIPLLGMVTIYRRIPDEKKPRPFRGRTVSKSFWLKLSVGFCILLLVPSKVFFQEDYGAEPPYYYYSIASVFMFFNRWQATGSHDIFSSETQFMEPIILLFAIVILLPAFFLIRKLRNRPADAQVLDLSLAALFATIILTSYLVERFLPSETFWYIPVLFPSMTLMNYGTLVIFVFIFLPLFSREAFLWGKERFSEERKTSKTRIPWPDKYSLAGCFWGLVTFLLPLVAVLQFPDPETSTLRFVSPIYIFERGIRDPAIPGNFHDWMEIYFDVYSVFDFVNFLTVNVFHIVFAFYVIRYLRGMTQRKRVIQLGILSILAPIMYYIVIASAPDIGELYAIPIPFALLIGLVVVVFITPNVKRSEVVKYTKDDEYTATEDYLEPPVDDPSVQVPLIYYLKGKLMQLLRGESNSNGGVD
jgi:parallel beta-helix repeat protein